MSPLFDPRSFSGVYRLLGCLTFVYGLSGCSTTPELTPAARYLQSQSSVKLNESLVLQVQDLRPMEERAVLDRSGYYRYVTGEGESVALSFAHDLAKILVAKEMVKEIRLAPVSSEALRVRPLLRINLTSWYGRVPNMARASKAAAMVLGKTVWNAEGRCQFEAIFVSDDGEIALGIDGGVVRLQVGSQATVDQEGRTVSAMAADRAIVAFLREFEAYLRKSH